MKRILIIIFLSIGNTSAWGDVASDFLKANASYRDGKYDQAIEGYENILNNKQESSALYFNLGNSYFKKQQLGKAIANYERARRLTPREPDVLANLQFARQGVAGEIERPLSAFEKIWDAHANFYSKNEMIATIVFFLFLLGFVHIFSLYFRLKKSRLILSAIAVVLVIFTYGLWVKIKSEENAAMIIESCPARFEPNDKATVYFELPQGQGVKLLEKQDNWIKIERLDGKLGWVLAQCVEKI